MATIESPALTVTPTYHPQTAPPAGPPVECPACSTSHGSLSLALAHLGTRSCSVRLTPAKTARLLRRWFPWEHATMVELDVRTQDYAMAYFCPACGAGDFNSVARAVIHAEAASRAETKTCACEHALLVRALRSGMSLFRKASPPTEKKKDAATGGWTYGYTHAASFRDTLEDSALQRALEVRAAAMRAYGALVAGQSAGILRRKDSVTSEGSNSEGTEENTGPDEADEE